MLTRRLLLLSGAALPLAAPALAAAPRRLQHPARPAASGDHQPAAPPADNGGPAQTPIGPVDTVARYAVIIDFTTGATLLAKDADTPMTPSSMTKLMTAYIVFGMLKSGRLRLDQELPVSEKAWRMGGSKMFVPVGGTVKVDDLIRGMIVQSGNDACIVLAEGVAGSEAQFVALMNAKAGEMGLTATHFVNATGWPDPGHQMSVRDIATVARGLIMDFPEYYSFFSEKSYKYDNIDQGNRNTLVDKGVADGLKTGHTEAGGYGIVASALRGGRRVIVVLNGMATMRERGEEGERLLDWGFASFENVTLFTASDTVQKAPVWLGTSATVPLVCGRDIVITVPRGWRSKARVAVEYDSPIPAPISRGSALGSLSVTGSGMPDVTVPLLAGADVARLGLPARAAASLSRLVFGS
jgi:D-alanyl-D-alanine carboxypeptidase (penicillin-binding protein 5/6)